MRSASSRAWCLAFDHRSIVSDHLSVSRWFQHVVWVLSRVSYVEDLHKSCFSSGTYEVPELKVECVYGTLKQESTTSHFEDAPLVFEVWEALFPCAHPQSLRHPTI